jgi:tetratricopeptide (TPR) repeat protein
MSEWRIDDETPTAKTDTSAPSHQAPSPENSTASLHEVNKLIFVQDFDAAEESLVNLFTKHPYDHEVLFRLVEVSWKTGRLPDLVTKLERASRELPESNAARFAWTLAEIRLLEQKAADETDNIELLNPSLSRGEFARQGDVFGLSAASELAGSKRLLGAPGALAFTSLASAKNFRITRNPDVADDASPAEVPHHAEIWVDTEKHDSHPHQDGKSWQSMPACIQRARQFVLDFPENYAAWFVNGCALEYAGSLSEAVMSWTKSISMQPGSLAVLATMTELQQMGVLPSDDTDYGAQFEALDKYLVHGSLETHMSLYREYLAKHEYAHAIASLRTLADWLQRQRGEVPAEVESLSLLGAMKAYEEGGNSSAAQACRIEAESLIMATRTNPRSAAQLKFMGEICQQFGIDSLARLCYISTIQASDATIDQVVQSTSHCIAVGCNEQTKEALQVAYENHHGASEIRFCQALCSLAIANIPIRKYMERKNKIRELLQTGDLGTALPLLQESLKEVDDDAETQYYMGEILSRFGADLQAKPFFQRTYELDPYNFESAVRYCYFLLKTSDYTKVLEVADATLALPWIYDTHAGELSWARSTALFALGDIEKAHRNIERALRLNPWNGAYLTLALRLYKPASGFGTPEFDDLARTIEDAFISQPGTFNSVAAQQWVDHAMATLVAGYAHYAYTLTRCLLIINPSDPRITEAFVRASAGFGSRTAAQHLLLSLQLKPDLQWPLAKIAVVVTRIYALDGKWELCREWTDIAEKSGVEESLLKATLLEIEAMGLLLEGKDARKAQSLLEAAIDVYESEKRPSPEAHIMLAYAQAVQGSRKLAIARVEQYENESLNVASLYFTIKIYERDNNRQGVKFLVGRAFQRTPTNLLERKLLEEIFQTNGTEQKGMSISLAS